MKRRRVFRYEIPINDQTHQLPTGRVLKVEKHRRGLVRLEAWVEVYLPEGWPAGPDLPTRGVQVFGTGHDLPPGAKHLGSCLDGSLVWHLYDVAEAGR